jgi:hypothetical protein
VRRMTAQVAARVTEVYAMLVAGLNREQIMRLANDKHGWGVSSRSIDYYISKAKERLEAEAKVRHGCELGKAIARLDTQYFKADSRKDHRGAVMAVGKAIDLLHLDQPADDGHDDELREFLDRWQGRE